MYATVHGEVFISKTIKLLFAAYPLRMQHLGEMTKNQDNVSEWSDKSTCALLFQ
jgi:hypothetical protein